MKITVTAKSNAREDKVEKIDEKNFIISTMEPPIQGKANYAIIKIIAKYFRISGFKVKIISGYKSKKKIFEVEI